MGEGGILSCDFNGNAEIFFAKVGKKKFSKSVIFGSGFDITEDSKAEECLAEFDPYLKKVKQIAKYIEYMDHMLETYKEYLD